MLKCVSPLLVPPLHSVALLLTDTVADFQCLCVLFYDTAVLLQVKGDNRGMLTALCSQLGVHVPGNLDLQIPLYLNHYFRRQVVMQMVRSRVLLLQKHKEYLRATYTRYGGDPGHFFYKQYLQYMLNRDSLGDQVFL